MKKAFIEQMFFGFLLLMGIVTFIATVNDERQARSKGFDLQDIADQSNKIMSIAYQRAISAGATSEMEAMCAAQTAATSILNADSLGAELISSGSLNYIWRDNGTYDGSGTFVSSTLDGRPDNVSTSVSTYRQNNFWYRFLNQDDFTIPAFIRASDLTDFNFDTTVYFRDVIEAGFYNMVGTYTLDSDGCVSDPQIILDNKDNFNKGDVLAEINWPERKIFFIADGYRRFGNYNGSKNLQIGLDSQINFIHDCVNSTDLPKVQMTTYSGVQQTNTELNTVAHVYFEDAEFNYDNQYDHMNEIAESDYGKFIAYIEPTENYTTEAKAYYNSLTKKEKKEVAKAHIYEEWVDYAQENNIDYTTDPNDDFVFVSEDLSTINGDEPWNSDKDFTDMSINLKKIFIPTAIDESLISSDSVINVVCP